jgi:hypothetical protein
MKIINGKSWFEACPPLEGVGGGIGKLSIFILTTLILFSCQNQEKEKETTSQKTEKTTDNSEAPSEFKISKIKDNPTLFENICTVSPMEFTDLYPRVRSISDDAHESLELVQILKKLGFEVKESGRGNFDLGPRIYSITMQHDSCKIRIDKLYYKTDTVGTFRVTERIKAID